MFTQKETRLLGKVLYQDWLPAVWLDEHQMGSTGPRIFVMPAMDPINPNVDPVIYRNAGLLGFAQAAALERAGKEGIIYNEMYTYWWEGAMAWCGWWHNMVGMLTEVASARVATTVEQQKADPSRPRPAPAPEEQRRAFAQDEGGILPAPYDVQFRAAYPKPWLGGRWSLRDIVDYELIATFALLDTAAGLREQLLESLYTAGRRQVELGKKGDPFAIAIPREQADRPTVVKLLQTLATGGVEIHQAKQSFTADGKPYPSGTYVILLSQPFRAYAKDMLEPQVYPKIAPAAGVPPRPPYDVAGWSLGMQMGVDTVFIKKAFEADLQKLDAIELPPGQLSGKGSVYLIGHESNNSLVAVNRLLRAGCEVSWLAEKITVNGKDYAPGAIAVRGGKDLAAQIAGLTRSLGIDAAACDLPAVRSLRIRAPRTALYQPWGGNMDEGWTRWLLEQNEFFYTTVHPEDLRKGDLLRRFDAVVFPDMSADQIFKGMTAKNMPEEYKGGIEDSGLQALRLFVEGGGTIIAMGQSNTLLMDKFAVPYKDSLRGLKREDFFCPGSVLRVQVDSTHPIAYGMMPEANAYFSNSMALEPVPGFSSMQASVIVRYPNSDILKSGWLQGESNLYHKVGAAEVKLGKGRMIMLPLRVQHRAQPYGTFKLLFNSILTSATLD
jgi:hypothetical protein